MILLLGIAAIIIVIILCTRRKKPDKLPPKMDLVVIEAPLGKTVTERTRDYDVILVPRTKYGVKRMKTLRDNVLKEIQNIR